MKFIELSHKMTDGLITFPDPVYPPVKIDFFWTQEEAAEHIGAGVAAALDRIEMINISGTYIDAPKHRYADGYHVSEIPLEKLVDLKYDVVRLNNDSTKFTLEDVKGHGSNGGAVLFYTGMSKYFGTPEYGMHSAYISVEAMNYLLEKGVVFFGIDAALVDDMEAATRPIHDTVLKAGGVICENMTNLEEICDLQEGLFSAVPLCAEMASFPVRAYVKR